MPSVTAISELIDDGKSSAFAWSAALITATIAVHEYDTWAHLGTESCAHVKEKLCPACRWLRSAHDRKWDAKADFGSHVHHLALAWGMGEEVDADGPSMIVLDGLELFYVQCEPEWLLLEACILFDKYPGLGYRGQFDQIGVINCPVKGHEGLRCPWLLDTKTGGYHPESQTLQLAGYRYADWVTDWSDGTERKIGPVPQVDHAGILLLAPEGYRVVELPVTPEVHSLFLRLREHWSWRKDMRTWKGKNPLRPAHSPHEVQTEITPGSILSPEYDILESSEYPEEDHSDEP
jgi:hypothetical protein